MNRLEHHPSIYKLRVSYQWHDKKRSCSLCVEKDYYDTHINGDIIDIKITPVGGNNIVEVVEDGLNYK